MRLRRLTNGAPCGNVCSRFEESNLEFALSQTVILGKFHHHITIMPPHRNHGLAVLGQGGLDSGDPADLQFVGTNDG